MIDLTTDPAEESAQGQDLFRAPGETAMIDDAREQAEASGWLPPEAANDWSAEFTPSIVVRRRDLYDAMQVLEAAAARATGHRDWRPRVEEALEDMQTTLVAHTAEIEAEDGLFDEVVARSPELTHIVDDLRREHGEMEEACGKALRASRDDDPTVVRRLILDLLGKIATHRQIGAEMLYDAYNVEIGAGD